MLRIVWQTEGGCWVCLPVFRSSGYRSPKPSLSLSDIHLSLTSIESLPSQNPSDTSLVVWQRHFSSSHSHAPLIFNPQHYHRTHPLMVLLVYTTLESICMVECPAPFFLWVSLSCSIAHLCPALPNFVLLFEFNVGTPPCGRMPTSDCQQFVLLTLSEWHQSVRACPQPRNFLNSTTVHSV